MKAWFTSLLVSFLFIFSVDHTILFHLAYLYFSDLIVPKKFPSKELFKHRCTELFVTDFFFNYVGVAV